MYRLTTNSPNQRITQIPDNHPVTRKQGENRQKHFSHLVENPWALGIHQETKERGKINSEPKRTKLVLYKFYINFVVLHKIAQKLNTCVFQASIVQIQLEIFQYK